MRKNGSNTWRISTYLMYSFVTLILIAAARVPMTAYSVLAQVLALFAAVLGAPLLTGWINQCRACWAPQRRPPLLLPYRTLPQALQQGLGDPENASPLFRIGPTSCSASWCWPAASCEPVTDLRWPAGGRCHRAGRLFAVARSLHVAGRR